MDVVVVENRVGQAIKVIERTQRLRQFLVQAIADFLRGRIGGNENRRFFPASERRPVQHLCVARRLHFSPALDAGHDETGGIGNGALQGTGWHGFDDDIGVLCAGQANIDASLASQSRQQGGQIVAVFRAQPPCDTQGDRPFKPGKNRQGAPAFHPKGQVNKIQHHFRVLPCGWSGACSGKPLHFGEGQGDRFRCIRGLRAGSSKDQRKSGQPFHAGLWYLTKLVTWPMRS